MLGYMDICSQCKTGDIVLFSCKDNFFSIAIQLMTHSKWSHVGMVLRDHKKSATYLWESTTLSNLKDATDNTFKKGVQLVLLNERIKNYDGEIAIRQLKGINIDNNSKNLQQLTQLQQELKNRPYEKHKLELLHAVIDRFDGVNRNKEDLSSVFCSELVAEAYQRLGLLDELKPSNEYIPKDFSEKGNLPLLNGAYLAPEKVVKTLKQVQLENSCNVEEKEFIAI